MSELKDSVAKTVVNRVADYPRIGASPNDIAEFCQRWHLTELWLFGSVLRDDFHSDSDIDFMIEFDRDHVPTLIDYVGLIYELSELVGRPVDVVMRRSVEQSENYIRRKEVLDSAEFVYASG